MRTASIILSILLIAYVVTLAIVVPFTVDEAWTWEEFVKGEFWNVVTYAHPVPNNHILNSLLVKPFNAISSSELSLRMPNVLAFLLYLYAAYSISTSLFTNKLLSFCLFASLTLHIPLLHFFAMCRGYGLSIGLLLFSISRLLLFVRSLNRRHMHLSLLAGILAVYASFTVLPAYLAVAATVLITGYKHQRKLLSSLKWPTLYTVIIMGMIAYPIRQAMSWGTLEFGGEKDFFHDTVLTMLLDLLGSIVHQYNTLIIALTSGLFFIIFVAVVRKALKKESNPVYLVAPFLFFFCILYINLQFYLLGVRFVIYRTALYLYPLSILALFSCMALYAGVYTRFIKVAALSVTGVLLFFFCTQVNLEPVYEWRFDANTKKVLSFIIADKKQERKLKLYVYHLSANSYSYYISRKYNNVIEPVINTDSKNVNMNDYDYLYLSKDEDDISAYKNNFQLVQAYNDGSFLLYRKLP